jgi:hypothetical protein
MKTAVQELFTKLEKEHPSLFNIHSVIGREFINDYYQFLEMEKKQIIDACNQEEFFGSYGYGICDDLTKGEQYYNETFKKGKGL